MGTVRLTGLLPWIQPVPAAICSISPTRTIFTPEIFTRRSGQLSRPLAFMGGTSMNGTSLLACYRPHVEIGGADLAFAIGTYRFL